MSGPPHHFLPGISGNNQALRSQFNTGAIGGQLGSNSLPNPMSMNMTGGLNNAQMQMSQMNNPMQMGPAMGGPLGQVMGQGSQLMGQMGGPTYNINMNSNNQMHTGNNIQLPQTAMGSMQHHSMQQQQQAPVQQPIQQQQACPSQQQQPVVGQIGQQTQTVQAGQQQSQSGQQSPVTTSAAQNSQQTQQSVPGAQSQTVQDKQPPGASSTSETSPSSSPSAATGQSQQPQTGQQTAQPVPQQQQQQQPQQQQSVSQQQQQSKEFNTASLCRIGQETVQDIVSRTQEVFQTLKTVQLPNGTPQGANVSNEKKVKVQEQLRTIRLLYKRLRLIYEKCNENCQLQGMEYTHIESLIPYRDELEPKHEEKKNSEAYRLALDEARDVMDQVVLKNKQLKDVIDHLRRIIWEINTMLMMKRS